MIIFTLRRLLLLLVTLFFLTFVGFSLSYFTPHAPLQGSSLWDAWLFWFNGLLHWDFGVSSINGQLISEQLKMVFPATMELCILAFGFALMVGIPVGMLAGIYRNKWQDKFISALALIGFSIPVFWLALLLTLFFSLTLGWLPVSGRFDLLYNVQTVSGFAIVDAWLSDSVWRDEMIVSALRHMVLPVLTLAVAPTTEVIRLMRISTIEVFDQNYVKAAATRGPVSPDDSTSPCAAQCVAAGNPTAWAAILNHADAGDDHRDGFQLAGPWTLDDQRHSPAGLRCDLRRSDGDWLAGYYC